LELELPTTPEQRNDSEVLLDTGICSVEKRLESNSIISPNEFAQINVIDNQIKILPQSFGNFSVLAQRFDSLGDFGPSQEPKTEFGDYGTKQTEYTPLGAQPQVTPETPMDFNNSGQPKDKFTPTPRFSGIRNTITPKNAGSNLEFFQRKSTLVLDAPIPAHRVTSTAKTGVHPKREADPKYSSARDRSPSKKFQDRSSVNKIADHAAIAKAKEKVVKDLLEKSKHCNILKLKNGIINTALAKNKKINRS
jgi:hypothetical protein